MAPRQRSPGRAAWWLAVVLGLATPASAGPVLHEYFEPTPKEDLELGATTRDGSLPAALETESGIVPAPDTSSSSGDGSRRAYGGSSTPNSTDSTYRIDRNTTRPSVVNYDDPFTPPVTPFKRLFAYDAVDDNLQLHVADKTLRELGIGGEVLDGEDQFYADLAVDLVKDTPVRIPSVAPHSRVLKAQLDPPLPFSIVADGAENWFIVAKERTRARLIMQLSAPRAAFGSPFAHVSYDELQRFLTPLPPGLSRHAALVLEQLGISQLLTPGEAVSRLVNHFRSFHPSNELPRARGAAELYEELATSKKGVCRHRGYAFVVTALGLGIPARFVRNEAHAWVEVFDGQLWRRIDLGGAAGQLQSEQDTRVAPHRVPSDPYEWPEGSESGLGMAEGADTSGGQPSAPSSGQSSTQNDTRRAPSAPSAAPAAPAPPDPTHASTEQEERDPRPRSELDFELRHRSARRGTPLSLNGNVEADGEACAFSRVDVSLIREGKADVVIGALPTNEAGEFSGEVTIPLTIDVGHYQVGVSTPGTASCAPSE